MSVGPLERGGKRPRERERDISKERGRERGRERKEGRECGCLTRFEGASLAEVN